MATTPYTQAFANYLSSLAPAAQHETALTLSLFEKFIRNEFGLEPEKNGRDGYGDIREITTLTPLTESDVISFFGGNVNPVERLKKAVASGYNLRPRKK